MKRRRITAKKMIPVRLDEERPMKRLYEELAEYDKADIYPFHMPGHKRNPACMAADFPVHMDITEITDFDNLHHPEGLIKKAQENAAFLYGVKETYFSVNGSTAALQAAISASVRRGGRILAARNCHKAVYHTIYLRDLDPVYCYPLEDEELGINGGISVSRVERQLESHPDVEAFVITSPTYDGVVSDISGIAEAAHRHGVPLIVDEAHGAHFPFSGYFPHSAINCGADLVVQSLHKTLPSLTQTAVLHRCSDRVSEGLLCRFMGMYQSSSPSYILMASIDACMAGIKKNGNDMFREYTKKLSETRKMLEKCKNIRLLTPKTGEKNAVFDYDRSKLLFSIPGGSMTATELFDLLHREYALELEMDGISYVVALTSVGDTEEGFQRLTEAILDIDRRLGQGQLSGRSDASVPEETDKDTRSDIRTQADRNPYKEMKQRMRLADAMDAEAEEVLLEESVGKISAEFAYLYPPGIPLIVPGEQVTGQLVRNLRSCMEQGLSLQGLRDSSNRMIRVVKE